MLDRYIKCDETAARMRHQVDARTRGQGANERQRVADRARAERRMVERVDTVAVAREELTNRRAVQRPELAERADRLRERAVDEDEERPAARCRGLFLRSSVLSTGKVPSWNSSLVPMFG